MRALSYWKISVELINFINLKFVLLLTFSSVTHDGVTEWIGWREWHIWGARDDLNLLIDKFIQVNHSIVRDHVKYPPTQGSLCRRSMFLHMCPYGEILLYPLLCYCNLYIFVCQMNCLNWRLTWNPAKQCCNVCFWVMSELTTIWSSSRIVF